MTGYTYIITDNDNIPLLVGSTSDLSKCLLRHKQRKVKNSFTSRFWLNKLIYYEFFDTISEAITRERYLKTLTRAHKEEVIAGMNPGWTDLSEHFMSADEL